MIEIKINNKKIETLIKIILCLSCPVLTLLISNRYTGKVTLAGIILSFIIFTFIVFKKIKIKNIDIKKLICSIFISGYMIKRFFPFCETNIDLVTNTLSMLHISINKYLLNSLIGIGSSFSLIFFIYIFIDKILPKIIDFLKNLTKTEKTYLIIIVTIGAVLTIIMNYFTNIFTLPKYENGFEPLFDTIYVSDTGYLVHYDAYFNISNSMNDIRQPLFGVFAIPFSTVAKIISEVCFFMREGYEYANMMQIMQFILIGIIIIMIARMLNLEEKYKPYLYLLLSCSYYFIIWTLVLEQYVIATFYLILALYIYMNKKMKINYLYTGAVGTLIVSGIIFPVITKFKNIKQWIKDVFKCFLAFMSIIIIGGQFPQVIDSYKSISHLIEGHGGLDISFTNKLQQFFEFVKGMFLPTSGTVTNLDKYKLDPISSLWYLGIVILILCVLGFILNRKNKFAKISLLWIIFSFFITVIIGWGTREKCLILYGLYFSWAYLSLIFLLLKKVIKNYNIFKFTTITLSMIMLILSSMEVINILEFGMKCFR